MEDVLKWLRNRFKLHPIRWIIWAASIFVGLLLIIALTSDIGFSAEVQQYRWYGILIALSLASLITLVVMLVDVIWENEFLAKEKVDLETKERVQTQTNEDLKKQIEHLRETIQKLLSEIESRRQITLTTVQRYNGGVYIRCRKTTRQIIKVQDQIRIFGQDGYLLGAFSVSEVNGNDILGTHIYLDPLWSGHIHGSAVPETSPPPHSMAILFIEEITNE